MIRTEEAFDRPTQTLLDKPLNIRFERLEKQERVRLQATATASREADTAFEAVT